MQKNVKATTSLQWRQQNPSGWIITKQVPQRSSLRRRLPNSHGHNCALPQCHLSEVSKALCASPPRAFPYRFPFCPAGCGTLSQCCLPKFSPYFLIFAIGHHSSDWLKRLPTVTPLKIGLSRCPSARLWNSRPSHRSVLSRRSGSWVQPEGWFPVRHNQNATWHRMHLCHDASKWNKSSGGAAITWFMNKARKASSLF